jgi:hypothetical protein
MEADEWVGVGHKLNHHKRSGKILGGDVRALQSRTALITKSMGATVLIIVRFVWQISFLFATSPTLKQHRRVHLHRRRLDLNFLMLHQMALMATKARPSALI